MLKEETVNFKRKIKGSIVSHRKITRALSQLKCKNQADIPSIMEEIKQQIAAKTQRIRLCDK